MSIESVLPPTTIAGMDDRAIAGLERILAEHPKYAEDFLRARTLARRWKFNSFTEAGASVARQSETQELFK
jgi:hypothetical protein